MNDRFQSGRPAPGSPVPDQGVSDPRTVGPSEPAAGPGERPEKGMLGSVRQKTTSQLNAQKARATEQLDQIAGNVRRSTQRLRAERHDVVASALERGVDQLERFSAQLRNRDMDELLADLERFGRRHPALFLGSSFAAGLMLARFAKASGDGSPSGAGRHSGGRASTSFNRPGPADAIGQESP